MESPGTGASLLIAGLRWRGLAGLLIQEGFGNLDVEGGGNLDVLTIAIYIATWQPRLSTTDASSVNCSLYSWLNACLARPMSKVWGV